MISFASDPFVRDFKVSGFKPSIGIISFANVVQDAESALAFLIGIGSTSFATNSSSPQQDFSHVLALPIVKRFVLKRLSERTGAFVKFGSFVGLGVVTTTFCGAAVTFEGCTIGLGEDGGDVITGFGDGAGVITGFGVVGGNVTTGLGVDGGDVTICFAVVCGVVLEGFAVDGGEVTGFWVVGGVIKLITGDFTGNSSGGSRPLFGSGTRRVGSSLGIFEFSFGGLIPGSVLILIEGLGIGTTNGATSMSLPLQPSGKKYRMFLLRCSSSLKSPTKDACLKC